MTANDWTAICDKPHDIRLIVADMDGTLLDGDSNIPDGFWPLLDGRRHNDGANYAFADGHAKWLRPEATESPVNMHAP